LKILLLITIVFIPINGICQQTTILTAITSTLETKESGEKMFEGIIAHADALNKNRKISEIKFLRKVFYQTRYKFLKEYCPYSSLDQLVSEGKYDCLTATALYSSIFEILGMNFKIIETNYHIFIIAHAEGKNILVETTDGTSGLITDSDEVIKRINEYKNSEPSTNKTNSTVFQFNFHLLKEVKGNQLPGLLYFNQAIKEFNTQNWISCLSLLEKSKSIYNSPRINKIDSLAVLLTKQLKIKKADITSTKMNSALTTYVLAEKD
jgi:hypothetical protein